MAAVSGLPMSSHAKYLSSAAPARISVPAPVRKWIPAHVNARSRDSCRCQAESEGSSTVPDALPVATADTDWRDFRARLIASSRGTSSSTKDASEAAPSSNASEASSKAGISWAHALPSPERGGLLLAHPLMFSSSQTYFYQAAILLLENNEKGSYGIILNRPTEYCLKDVTEGGSPLSPEFESCLLHMGGDVGGSELQMLHGMAGLEGAVEVVRGVYMGGFTAAKAGVADGTYKPEQFKWYIRYAGWGPGQLESECKRGVWFPAAASADMVLAGEHKGGDMWHAILSLMGGDYARLSSSVVEAEQAARGDSSLQPGE